MREFIKGHEPKELTEYKLKEDAVYDGRDFTVVKNKIREHLLAEQGAVCAYCMDRISLDPDKMKIEHWLCQNQHKAQQLEYRNLLACCMGHQGSPFSDQTCDTRKGASNLKYSPCDPTHHINTIIKYQRNGKIYSSDAEFDQQLNNILNLNKPRLIANRKAAVDTIQAKLNTKVGRRTQSDIARVLEKVIDNKQKEFMPFYGAIAYYLQNKLK
ncbi:TIGR02646 family protein [Siccibacter turicensis]